MNDLCNSEPRITDTVFAQIMELRKRPDCPNLLSLQEVFALALRLEMCELAELLFERTPIYSNFILTGEREVADDE
jgi:hypothetical protein